MELGKSMKKFMKENWIFFAMGILFFIIYHYQTRVPLKDLKPIINTSHDSSLKVGPYEGYIAPDATFLDLSGKEIKLSTFAGKVIILNFWVTWCAPCIHEIPSMNELFDRLKNRENFTMIAVSADTSVKIIEEHIIKQRMLIPVLHDKDGKVGYSYYGITGFPETFIINKKGVIVNKIIGPMNWSDEKVVEYVENLIRE